jgi:hypothetical protein
MRISLRTCSYRRNRSTCSHRRTCSRRTLRTGSHRHTCNICNIRSTLWRCSTCRASRPDPLFSKRCRSAQTRASSRQGRPMRFRKIYRISLQTFLSSRLKRTLKPATVIHASVNAISTGVTSGSGPLIWRKPIKDRSALFRTIGCGSGRGRYRDFVMSVRSPGSGRLPGCRGVRNQQSQTESCACRC